MMNDCKQSTPLVVSYGGGVNSTAVLVGMAERRIVPDLILFADTGGEKPETYATIAEVSAWCVAHGMPSITVVQRLPTARADYATLEEECVQGSRLPSKAYGFSKCAAKWKLDPQSKFLAKWQTALNAWESGILIRKAIGFHAGETRRIKPDIDKGTVKVYPLIEWGWHQRDCLDAIARAGLSKPAKSACFFCPSSSKREVATLARDRPDLFSRAVTIERKAIEAGNLLTVEGLGRHWRWQDIGASAVAQCMLDFDDEGESLPCGCHDGGDPDDDVY